MDQKEVVVVAAVEDILAVDVVAFQKEVAVFVAVDHPIAFAWVVSLAAVVVDLDDMDVNI